MAGTLKQMKLKGDHVLIAGVVLVIGYFYLKNKQSSSSSGVEKMSVTNFVAAPGLTQSGSNIKCYPGADANICRAECAADSGCVAYSADGPSASNNATKTCCTKSKLDNIVAAANSTLFSPAGVVIKNPDVMGWNSQAGKDIPGSDLACYTGVTQAKCQAQCAIDNACQAYVYVQGSQGGSWSNAGCCKKSVTSGISNNSNVTLWTKPT